MARTTKRGASLIELLASLAILSASLIAMMTLWAFNYNLTQDHGTQNYGMNLARRTVEEAKLAGFYGVPEGSFSIYADAEGNVINNEEVSNAKFRVDVSVVSDKLSINSSNGTVSPADTALRQMVISVYDLEEVTNNQPRLVTQTGTYLARSGV